MASGGPRHSSAGRKAAFGLLGGKVGCGDFAAASAVLYLSTPANEREACWRVPARRRT